MWKFNIFIAAQQAKFIMKLNSGFFQELLDWYLNIRWKKKTGATRCGPWFTFLYWGLQLGPWVVIVVVKPAVALRYTSSTFFDIKVDKEERRCEEFTCDYHSPGCFPGTALVNTTGQCVPLRDLQVGEVIETPSGSENVLSFLHKYGP